MSISFACLAAYSTILGVAEWRVKSKIDVWLELYLFTKARRDCLRPCFVAHSQASRGVPLIVSGTLSRRVRRPFIMALDSQTIV